MSRTVDRLHEIITNDQNMNQMTPGVKADFGFDSNIYSNCNQKLPTSDQLSLLYKRYKEIFTLNSSSSDEIHSIIRSNNMASFELRKLLGNDFLWVHITNDMFDYSSR